jgi:hypothetical protein
MSVIEMVAFKKDGFAVPFADIQNAFLGAPMVWHFIEEKYLPPFKPQWVVNMFGDVPDDKIEETVGFKPTRTAPLSTATTEEKPIREIWRFYHDPAISRTDKIVLGTTFDLTLVRREQFEMVIDALEAFEETGSFKEQAMVIRQMLLDPDIIALGWNQTSVTKNQWTHCHYDGDTDEHSPYNCLSESNHFWLFDDIH